MIRGRSRPQQAGGSPVVSCVAPGPLRCSPSVLTVAAAAAAAVVLAVVGHGGGGVLPSSLLLLRSLPMTVPVFVRGFVAATPLHSAGAVFFCCYDRARA